ncbi:MAG: outer membrane lipoprotein-sorting protein [Thermoanaerobaculia bacterium]|nr:outer membrane lipoprotein-sorting protein [Thermoanaerobaculia bacterium]
MFERIAALSLLATLLAPSLAGVPPGASSQSGSQEAASGRDLIARADQVRTFWDEAALKVRVTAETPGKPVQAGEFAVYVKGKDLSLVWFLGAEKDRKALVTKGEDAWLLLPKTQNAIKVPKSHRVAGGFSVSDAARVRFSEDYESTFERKDGDLEVYRLISKEGLKLQFPIIRLWVDAKEARFHRTEFLLSSGRKAKEITFDAYALFGGKPGISKMTIVDVLKPGKTVVEYLEYERVSLPDAFFDREAVRKRLATSANGR